MTEEAHDTFVPRAEDYRSGQVVMGPGSVIYEAATLGDPSATRGTAAALFGYDAATGQRLRQDILDTAHVDRALALEAVGTSHVVMATITDIDFSTADIALRRYRVR